MLDQKLIFQSAIAKNKPESIRNTSAICPFCDRSQLNHIYEERGTMIWLPNKYPVLNDTLQTVLIESDQCDGDLSTYSLKHATNLFAFALEKWEEIIRDPQFKSVLLFRNFGPLSGGTLRHPHMQIVGLKDVDYHTNVKPNDFIGIKIEERSEVELNLSTDPRMGFYEWNVSMRKDGDVSIFAELVQKTTVFLLNHFHFPCTSYNLFFYRMNQKTICKIIPRFVTSPLYVGYAIPQVPSTLEDTAIKMKEWINDDSL